MKVNTQYNFLNETEISFLKSLCENFVRSTDTGNLNVDNRMVVFEEGNLDSYKKKIINYLNTNEISKYERTGEMWITKVTEDSSYGTDDESFHLDFADMTFVSYFDDKFIGGVLEYIDNNNTICKIVPEIGLNVVMKDKTHHRVTNVIEGVRYSLTSFFNVVEKNKKTLL
jgi:hypothetical protein